MELEKKLREKISEISPENQTIANQIEASFRAHCPEAENLGDLVSHLAAYGAMRGTANIEHPKKAEMLMVGDHGIAKYGVSAFPPSVTLHMTFSYLKEYAGANVFARHANMDVIVTDVGINYDMSAYQGLNHCKVAWGTEDFTKGPAMTREQAVRSILVGLELAEKMADQGYGLFALSEMGIANTTSSAAIAAAFCGLTPEEATGRGSGIGDNRLLVKRQVVAEGLEINKPDPTDSLDVLRKVGGYEIGALVGVILGGAIRNIPTIVDGYIATASALIAYHLAPVCRDYMIGSHLSAEPAHKAMLGKLSLRPLVDMGMRLGEGTGASLAAHIMDDVIAIYRDSIGLES